MTPSVRSAPNRGVDSRRTVRASEAGEPSLAAIPAPGRRPSPAEATADGATPVADSGSPHRKQNSAAPCVMPQRGHCTVCSSEQRRCAKVWPSMYSITGKPGVTLGMARFSTWWRRPSASAGGRAGRTRRRTDNERGVRKRSLCRGCLIGLLVAHQPGVARAIAGSEPPGAHGSGRAAAVANAFPGSTHLSWAHGRDVQSTVQRNGRERGRIARR